MTLPAWPFADAPAILSSERLQLDDGVFRSKMASGIERPRVLYDHLPGTFTCDFLMTYVQLNALLNFAIAQRIDAFTLPLCVGFSPVVSGVGGAPDTLSGPSVVEVTFAEFPTHRYAGVNAWRVSCSFRVESALDLIS